MRNSSSFNILETVSLKLLDHLLIVFLTVLGNTNQTLTLTLNGGFYLGFFPDILLIVIVLKELD